MIPRRAKAIATFRELERAIAMHQQVMKDNCDDSAGPKRDCNNTATRKEIAINTMSLEQECQCVALMAATVKL